MKKEMVYKKGSVGEVCGQNEYLHTKVRFWLNDTNNLTMDNGMDGEDKIFVNIPKDSKLFSDIMAQFSRLR